MTTAGGVVTRRLYGTELRGYAFIMLTQFTTAEESAAVQKVLQQLRIEAAK